MVFWMGYSEQILRQKDESEEFEDVIAILTLPFNEKHWKKKIGELLSRFGFSRFTCLQLFPTMILACLICVFYVSLCLFWSIGLLCLYVIYKTVTLSMILFFSYSFSSSLSNAVPVCAILLGGTYVCYILILALQYFLLGIVLNLVYFIPYLASFLVLTFHCYSYWKSVEEKYFVLKQLI
jgi:hypothetical protein